MPFANSFNRAGPPEFKMNDISDPLTRHYLNMRNGETEEQRVRREREEREAAETSKKIDEWIAKEKATRERDRKRKKTAKVLLVGQSESGKSTTLKNFQLHYAPKAFQSERAKWKIVILLNLVRSIRKMHEALTTYATKLSGTSTPQMTPTAGSPVYQRPSFDFINAGASDEEDEESDLGVPSHRKRPRLAPQHRLLLLRLRPILSLEAQLVQVLMHEDGSGGPPSFATVDYRQLDYTSPINSGVTDWNNERPDDISSSRVSTANGNKSIASPILEENSAPQPFAPASWSHSRTSTLSKTLEPDPLGDLSTLSNSLPSDGNTPLAVPTRSQTLPISSRSPLSPPTYPRLRPSVENDLRNRTYSAGSGSVLSPRAIQNPHAPLVKSPLIRHTQQGSSGDSGAFSSSGLSSMGSSKSLMRSPTPSSVDEKDVPERVLAACVPDILALWKDEVLNKLLCGPLSMGGLGLKVHEDAGFFLNDVERITAPNYLPTNEDVLRARLKTVGVSEHRFILEQRADSDYITELLVYDVGGSRTQRHQWMKYFDDINVIIFLAPISAFDQRLAEDASVNRLMDTFNLWQDICKSPSLVKVDFLLFLNKCDLLHAKLKRGLKLNKFIPQYNGDNTLPDVVQFFKTVFQQIWKKHTAGLQEKTKSSRAIHVHSTSMIDYHTSRTVIKSVQDCALRANLKTAMII